MSLITPMKTEGKIKKLQESFGETFGKNARRSKPTLSCFNLEEYAVKANEMAEGYTEEKDRNIYEEKDIDGKDGPGAKYMTAGQSKRIYRELHKVKIKF